MSSYGEVQARANVTLTGNPTPKVSLSETLAQALEQLNLSHQRFEMVEERIHGAQPSRGADVAKGPSGLADLAMQIRTAALALNERIDRLSAAL
ncbi:MAG TPA: hypothetical protein VKA83_09130 [Methylomirabilota bacterium]|nr:hypothetical protein [Methylomirabilota bacterium]